ncbi:hypothetical protein [Pendulispora albinea]|uniref:Uncharacterized protein n=1 Tax=Pendulispora albinea TaxID=2741071 RepID=A0ABZ2M0V4_9BACT
MTTTVSAGSALEARGGAAFGASAACPDGGCARSSARARRVQVVHVADADADASVTAIMSVSLPFTG